MRCLQGNLTRHGKRYFLFLTSHKTQPPQNIHPIKILIRIYTNCKFQVCFLFSLRATILCPTDTFKRNPKNMTNLGGFCRNFFSFIKKFIICIH